MRLIYTLLLVLCIHKLSAQELNCTVKVIDKQIQTKQATERQVFRQMEQAIQDFLNNRKWTDDDYDEEEKINCVLEITLLKGDINTGQYEATALIRSTRPVYNTSYETPMLVFVDRAFQFKYLKSQPIDFNNNTFFGDLSAMLGYYAYIIIGLDQDSFAKNGGQQAFENAFNIANNAQNSSSNKAWQRNDTRNRFFLIENLMSQQMVGFREGSYKYHRHALDNFAQKEGESQKIMLDYLKEIESINRLKPSSILINSFMDAKVLELVGALKTADEETKKEARRILVKINPGKTETYNQLK